MPRKSESLGARVAELETAIDDLLRAGLNARLFSAAAAGVSAEGERAIRVVGTVSFGDDQAVTTSSLFDLASLTKTYTALTAMALVDQGELDLDSPVGEHMAVGAGAGAERITLRMLLCHTSGFPAISEIWRDPTISTHDRMARVLGSELANEPNSRFVYSCPGYVAIGALIVTVQVGVLGDAGGWSLC